MKNIHICYKYNKYDKRDLYDIIFKYYNENIYVSIFYDSSIDLNNEIEYFDYNKWLYRHVKLFKVNLLNNDKFIDILKSYYNINDTIIIFLEQYERLKNIDYLFNIKTSIKTNKCITYPIDVDNSTEIDFNKFIVRFNSNKIHLPVNKIYLTHYIYNQNTLTNIDNIKSIFSNDIEIINTFPREYVVCSSEYRNCMPSQKHFDMFDNFYKCLKFAQLNNYEYIAWIEENTIINEDLLREYIQCIPNDYDLINITDYENGIYDFGSNVKYIKYSKDEYKYIYGTHRTKLLLMSKKYINKLLSIIEKYNMTCVIDNFTMCYRDFLKYKYEHIEYITALKDIWEKYPSFKDDIDDIVSNCNIYTTCKNAINVLYSNSNTSSIPVNLHKCICTIIKDEHQYVEEFCKYHHDYCGFDHIYLLEDIGSKSHEQILNKYDYVTIIDLNTIAIDTEKNNINNGIYHIRIAFDIFYRLYKKYYDWMALIDVDEFIDCDKHQLNKILTENFDKPMVTMEWRIMKCTGHITHPNNNQIYSLLETYTDYTDKCKWLNVKEIINCSSKFDDIVEVNNWIAIPHIITDELLNFSDIKLKHFMCKSFEEWIFRLNIRGECDNGKNDWHRKLNDWFDINPEYKDKKQEILKMFNIDENNFVIKFQK